MTESNPDRDTLLALREQGLTREQIAETMGVSMTTVRKWIRELGVPRPPTRNKRDLSRTSPGPTMRLDDGMTLLELAREMLGERFKDIRGRGYYIDGTPAHIDRIRAVVDEELAVRRGRVRRSR